MLPSILTGPGKVIGQCDNSERFVAEAISRYPHLDRDFILQICFEQPGRFNEVLPGFDPDCHVATRQLYSAVWIRDNIRYDNGVELNFWREQFDLFLRVGEETPVFSAMIATKTWPFPPVVICADFAESIGIRVRPGRPYHLIEGTHRVSYMRRMLEREIMSPEQMLELIVLAPNNSLQARRP